jgi:signal transduction histidine kinase
MARPAERLMRCGAAELNLDECPRGEETARTLQLTFPGGAGRWEVRRNSFRNRGEPHQLLVLTDLSRALREEERQAWQRLVRVLGHELNNSLAPIKSIAGSLEKLVGRELPPADWRDDMQRGLSVISSRAAALSRFMSAYARLSGLPQPRFAPVDVCVLVRRVVGLETRLGVTLVEGPEVVINADGDQLEQVLINLLRNAVDAAVETDGGVRMGWTKSGTELEIWIEDDGLGLANTTNLFVPFFTTKPTGTGLVLAIVKRVVEANRGEIAFESPEPGGATFTLRLPTDAR